MMNTETKRTICIFFNVHQPTRLKNYRFFNIGVDHDYFDEESGSENLKRLVDECYLPANEVLGKIIKDYGQAIKVSFGISGIALDQFRKHTPQLIDSFRHLYDTGNIEFVAEPYAYSLALLSNAVEYRKQVKKQIQLMNSIFGCKPVSFINPNLIYLNDINRLTQHDGEITFKKTLGTPVELKKAFNPVFNNPLPESDLMLIDNQLREDITARFTIYRKKKWPLTHRNFISWLNSIYRKEKIVNLFFDYGDLWKYRKMHKEVFNFSPVVVDKLISSGKWTFRTVSEIAQNFNTKKISTSPESARTHPRDTWHSPWLRNKMQLAAFSTLYSIKQVMQNSNDRELLEDWNRLQACDYFSHMSLKPSNISETFRNTANPFDSPYKAFINYMNILSDFLIRVRGNDTILA